MNPSADDENKILFDVSAFYVNECKKLYDALMQIPLMQWQIAKIIAEYGVVVEAKCTNCCRKVTLVEENEFNVDRSDSPPYGIWLHDEDTTVRRSTDSACVLTFSYAVLDDTKGVLYFSVNTHITHNNKGEILCTNCEATVLHCVNQPFGGRSNHAMKCSVCSVDVCNNCMDTIHMNPYGKEDEEPDYFFAFCEKCELQCPWMVANDHMN